MQTFSTTPAIFTHHHQQQQQNVCYLSRTTLFAQTISDCRDFRVFNAEIFDISSDTSSIDIKAPEENNNSDKEYVNNSFLGSVMETMFEPFL